MESVISGPVSPRQSAAVWPAVLGRLRVVEERVPKRDGADSVEERELAERRIARIVPAAALREE